MFVDDLPLLGFMQQTMEVREIFALKRRNATAARNAGSISERRSFHWVQFDARKKAEVGGTGNARPAKSQLKRNIFVGNRRTAYWRVLRLRRALIEVIASR